MSELDSLSEGSQWVWARKRDSARYFPFWRVVCNVSFSFLFLKHLFLFSNYSHWKGCGMATTASGATKITNYCR